MHIHDIFSVNLRQACRKFESISEVARRVGINRQQFNRYLSGENIPNKRTIGRLAKFLDVDEAELFRLKEDKTSLGEITFDKADAAVTLDLALGGGRQRVLLPGYYCCYFPLQGTSQFLVKSVLKVAKKGQQSFFIRHTLFRSATSPKSTLARGKHRGVILANDNDVYLIALNALHPQHLSMIVIERQQVAGSSVLQGLSITRGTTSHFTCRVCLQPIGDSLKTAKSHLASRGIVSMNSRDLDPTIVLMMSAEQNPDPMSTQLALPRFEELMLAQSQDYPLQSRIKAIV